jgi:small subunit ribosomal protein S15
LLFRKIVVPLQPRWQHSAPPAHSFVGQKIFFNLLKFQIMYLDSEKKKEIFGTYGTSNTDTGSAESQIALFSYRIAHLTEHLKANRKDYSTQRALTMLVGKRRSLLNYLKERDINRYRAIVAKLGLRR